MIIWVLKDEKIGTSNQALGVVKALGVPFVEKNIKFNKLSGLPNLLKIGSTGIANFSEILDDKNPPDLIIGAGRRLVNLASFLKKRYKAKAVQIMNFGKYKASDFDLIVVPKHDNLKNLLKNQIEVIGSPHVINDELLNKASLKWQDTFKELPRPLTALIVGGSTKSHRFTADMAEKLGKLVADNFKGESLLITNSRRTGEDNEKLIFNQLNGFKSSFYDFRTGGDNPYHGFLALADKIIVTGDSMSMCSEAAFTGKPLFIYAPSKLISSKHGRFHQTLYSEGYATELKEDTDIDFKPNVKKLDPSAEIAAIIKERLF